MQFDSKKTNPFVKFSNEDKTVTRVGADYNNFVQVNQMCAGGGSKVHNI